MIKEPYHNPYYYYQLSNACYKKNVEEYLNRCMIHHTIVIKDKTINNWRFILFKNQDSHEFTIGFRGTDNLQNWRDNAKRHITGNELNLPEINAKVQKWRQKFGKISAFTGHSAGGFFATYVQKEWKISRVTFNGHFCLPGKRNINLCTSGDIVSQYLSDSKNYFSVGDGGHSLHHFSSLIKKDTTWNKLLDVNKKWVQSKHPPKIDKLEKKLFTCLKLYKAAEIHFKTEKLQIELDFQEKLILLREHLNKDSRESKVALQELAYHAFTQKLKETYKSFKRSGSVQVFKKNDTVTHDLLEAYLIDIENLIQKIDCVDNVLTDQISSKQWCNNPNLFTHFFSYGPAPSSADTKIPNAYLLSKLSNHLIDVLQDRVMTLEFKGMPVTLKRRFLDILKKLIRFHVQLERLTDTLPSKLNQLQIAQQAYILSVQKDINEAQVFIEKKTKQVENSMTISLENVFKKTSGENFVGKERFLLSEIAHSKLVTPKACEKLNGKALMSSQIYHFNEHTRKKGAKISLYFLGGATAATGGAGLGLGLIMSAATGGITYLKMKSDKNSIRNYSSYIDYVAKYLIAAEINIPVSTAIEKNKWQSGKHIKPLVSKPLSEKVTFLIKRYFDNQTQSHLCNLQTKTTIEGNCYHSFNNYPKHHNRKHLLKVITEVTLLNFETATLCVNVDPRSLLTADDLKKIPKNTLNKNNFESEVKKLLKDRENYFLHQAGKAELTDNNAFKTIEHESDKVFSNNPNLLPLLLPKALKTKLKMCVTKGLPANNLTKSGTFHLLYDFSLNKNKTGYELWIQYGYLPEEEKNLNKIINGKTALLAVFNKDAVDACSKVTFPNGDIVQKKPNLNQFLIEAIYARLPHQVYKTENGFFASCYDRQKLSLFDLLKIKLRDTLWNTHHFKRSGDEFKWITCTTYLPEYFRLLRNEPLSQSGTLINKHINLSVEKYIGESYDYQQYTDQYYQTRALVKWISARPFRDNKNLQKLSLLDPRKSDSDIMSCLTSKDDSSFILDMSTNLMKNHLASRRKRLENLIVKLTNSLN